MITPANAVQNCILKYNFSGGKQRDSVYRTIVERLTRARRECGAAVSSEEYSFWRASLLAKHLPAPTNTRRSSRLVSSLKNNSCALIKEKLPSARKSTSRHKTVSRRRLEKTRLHCERCEGREAGGGGGEKKAGRRSRGPPWRCVKNARRKRRRERERERTRERALPRVNSTSRWSRFRVRSVLTRWMTRCGGVKRRVPAGKRAEKNA